MVASVADLSPLPLLLLLLLCTQRARAFDYQVLPLNRTVVNCQADAPCGQWQGMRERNISPGQRRRTPTFFSSVSPIMFILIVSSSYFALLIPHQATARAMPSAKEEEYEASPLTHRVVRKDNRYLSPQDKQKIVVRLLVAHVK